MKTDAEIQKDVMDELRWEPLLNATEIGVAVKNGIVTLSGTVDSYSEKVAAEAAAKSVFGVKAVVENVAIKLKASGKRNDTELAQAVLNALKWHSSVREDKMQVKVENAWVTLDGEVDWEFQKSAAKDAVQNLVGVMGITNNIRIIPAHKVTDVKQQIMSAFQRSATVDAGKIIPEVVGSKVILKGKVRSYAEKRDAESAAWLAPGVTAIENKLEIDPLATAY